jgi:hypothetical protein
MECCYTLIIIARRAFKAHALLVVNGRYQPLFDSELYLDSTLRVHARAAENQ